MVGTCLLGSHSLLVLEESKKKISAGLWKQNIAYQLAGWMASLTIYRVQRGSQPGV